MTNQPNQTTYSAAYWRGVLRCYLGHDDFEIMYASEYVGWVVDGKERSITADRLESKAAEGTQ